MLLQVNICKVADGETDCARSDAFSSLCYRPGHSRGDSVDSVASTTLSRDPSASSESTGGDEWDVASHYRRVARADLRREERREERRRRRAEGSVASSAMRSTTLSISSATSSSASRVPDLIGGHSRNPSTASSASSSSWTSLSRNASSASTMSVASRRGYRGDAVEVIQEAEDEEYLDSRPYPAPNRLPGMGHRRKQSGNRKRVADPLGMGKDMRDILEEIISMEKNFAVDDDDVPDQTPPPGLFTAVFDRPPRTPSPVPEKRYVPGAPGAPTRGHRSTLSNPHGPPLLGAGFGAGSGPLTRPPSLMGHQSSLSESHTALYLVTASPVSNSRRSASPQLAIRNSLTFDSESAGPVLPPLAPRFDSPSMNVTPSRRRPQISPNANYADMGGWRFPSSVTSSSLASSAGPAHTQVTPRGPSHSSGRNGHGAFGGNWAQATDEDEHHRVAPHLLWPNPHPNPNPPNLGTSPFPTSPADTPSFFSHRQRREDVRLSPPRSGLRLGAMMGSGVSSGSLALDAEMDIDMDDESTVHGHGYGHGADEDGYLPVIFESDSVRRARGW